MKVLLDQCVPKRLAGLIAGHETRTAFEMGWSDLGNGALLRAAASAGFSVFITIDQNLQYQQNLESLPLHICLLSARSADFESLKACELPLAAALRSIDSATAPSRRFLRITTDGFAPIA